MRVLFAMLVGGAVLLAARPASAQSLVTNTALRISGARALAASTISLQAVTETGTNAGTGIFFSFVQDQVAGLPAVVTCKHLVDGAREGILLVVLKQADGSPDEDHPVAIRLEDFQRRWIPHPDPKVDLCAMPLVELLEQLQRRGQELYCKPLGVAALLPESQWKKLGPMQRLFVVSHPPRFADAARPITQLGAAATDPARAYRQRNQFLLDAPLWPGSAGAPVFLYDETLLAADPRAATGARPARLVGIVAQDFRGRTESAGSPMTPALVIKSTELLALDELFRNLLKPGQAAAPGSLPAPLPSSSPPAPPKR